MREFEKVHPSEIDCFDSYYEDLMDNYVHKYQADLKTIGDACVDIIELKKMGWEETNLLMQSYVNITYCAISEIGSAIDSFYPHKKE